MGDFHGLRALIFQRFREKQEEAASAAFFLLLHTNSAHAFPQQLVLQGFSRFYMRVRIPPAPPK